MILFDWGGIEAFQIASNICQANFDKTWHSLTKHSRSMKHLGQTLAPLKLDIDIAVLRSAVVKAFYGFMT